MKIIIPSLKFTKFFSTNFDFVYQGIKNEKIESKNTENNQKNIVTIINQNIKEKQPLYKKITKTDFTIDGKHPYATNGIKQSEEPKSIKSVTIKNIDTALKISENDNKSSLY